MDDLAQTVTYLGRQVLLKGFRVFLYGLDNAVKLVESYSEYSKHIDSGKWFSTPEQVPNCIQEQEPELEPEITQKPKKQSRK